MVAVVAIVTSVFFLVPTMVLANNYRKTKFTDYLIFLFVFLSAFINLFISGIFEIDVSSNLTHSFRDGIILKILFLTDFSGWFFIYLLSVRLKYTEVKRRHKFVGILTVLVSVSILLMSYGKMPQNVNFLGLLIPIQIESEFGYYFAIGNTVLVSQGYDIMLVLFRSYCAGHFLNAVIGIQTINESSAFKYSRALWILSMSTYLLTQILKILDFLDILELIQPLFNFLFLISGFVMMLIAIFLPEAIVLSNAQSWRILKLYKLTETQSIHKTQSDPFLSDRFVDYLSYLSELMFVNVRGDELYPDDLGDLTEIVSENKIIEIREVLSALKEESIFFHLKSNILRSKIELILQTLNQAMEGSKLEVDKQKMSFIVNENNAKFTSFVTNPFFHQDIMNANPSLYVMELGIDLNEFQAEFDHALRNLKDNGQIYIVVNTIHLIENRIMLIKKLLSEALSDKKNINVIVISTQREFMQYMIKILLGM